VIPFKDNIPTDRFPVVTVALILANVLMYFGFQHGTLLGGPSDVNVLQYGAIPIEITHPGVQCVPHGVGYACGQGLPGQPALLTVFTSMFMHGSLLHLGGNMLFLWVFGNNVEDAMGPVKFLAFYLVGGLAAIGLQAIVDPNSAAPTIGASGAVAGVLGGYILLHPRARVWTWAFIIILPLPAILVLGYWFLLQLYSGLQNFASPGAGGGGVAYFAHIGGFVFGLLTIRLLATKRKSPPPHVPVY
jgi:membrane associated rhomboid family serine protease